MKIFNKTVTEINKVLSKNKIRFILTRFNGSEKTEPDDLDILVPNIFFKKVIKVCKEQGYKTSSHDNALGGRIKGMQINLMKPLRIKIDLHQDFTWRKTRYFDLDLIWNNLEMTKINGINIPAPEATIDAFIVMVNLIFEKTYINKEDFDYFNRSKDKIFNNINFDDQAKKYYWYKTFSKFKSWFNNIENQPNFPIFLPAKLVFYSYLEKLWGERKIDVISLLYYIFFRIRYRITEVLPYE